MEHHKTGSFEAATFQTQKHGRFLYVLEDKGLWNNFASEAASHGVNEQTPKNHFVEAEKSGKGFVLTLIHALAAEFQVFPGEDHDQMKIITSNSLGIQFISGIEPVGQPEWDILEKIQLSID